MIRCSCTLVSEVLASAIENGSPITLYASAMIGYLCHATSVYKFCGARTSKTGVIADLVENVQCFDLNCDQACENQPSERKIHVAINLCISLVLYGIFNFCKFYRTPQ